MEKAGLRLRFRPKRAALGLFERQNALQALRLNFFLLWLELTPPLPCRDRTLVVGADGKSVKDAADVQRFESQEDSSMALKLGPGESLKLGLGDTLISGTWKAHDTWTVVMDVKVDRLHKAGISLMQGNNVMTETAASEGGFLSSMFGGAKNKTVEVETEGIWTPDMPLFPSSSL